jgi:hypothetical protein
MKRLPEIITLCCTTLCLLTAWTTGKRPDYNAGGLFHFTQGHDTTGLTGFLKVDSFNLEIIPPSSGIQFFRNSIVFLSNTKNEGKMLAKHVSFGSIEAYTAMVKDTSLGMHMPFSPSASFSYPCEAITFSADYKTMYFTKIGKKETKEKIYRAELKQTDNSTSDWISDENSLEFCTGKYRFTHPALSADGNMMIFASDMAGSLGGMDLFVVRKNGVKWSKPENLGKSINTVRDECFPYLDSEDNLFFSSDGLAGMGGYDIYTCNFNMQTWDKPMNLSRRINSANDDIAFSIDRTDGRSAFYTKKQRSGSGEMQLFKVTLKQEPSENNPTSISYIYNGKLVPEAELTAVKPEEQAKPPESLPVEVKKTDASPATSATAKYVMIKPTSETPEEIKNVVVYRIQFLTTDKPRKETQVVFNGVTYKTYEYFYLNAYRYTVGEFTTLAPARQLQSICRKSGYPQAFVAAFKDNMRSVDLNLFR